MIYHDYKIMFKTKIHEKLLYPTFSSFNLHSDHCTINLNRCQTQLRPNSPLSLKNFKKKRICLIFYKLK